MNINAVNGNTSTGALSSPDKGQLSQESFMKMLLAQLKMQNPLNPFDASTMMQQIAQLTGLSSTQKLADSVETFKSNLGVSQVLEASRLVGKNVQLATESINLAEGKEANGAVSVPAGVQTVEVTIADSAGKPVRILKLDAAGEGVLDFAWNGLDDEGKAMPPGFYTMSAKADLGGESIKLATAGTFKVNSVALDRASSTVILNVDGLGGVSMNDVVKIL